MHALSRTLLAAAMVVGATAAQDLYDIATIRTIEVTAPADWRTVMAANYASQTYIKVDVKIDNVVYRDVGARHRGFSTYRFLPANKTDKRPWKLSFDEFVPGQDVQGYNTLNITNNIWDPSFVREVAGYEFMRRYLPAPKSCYVKFVVNGEDLGLFVNTQQINRDFLEEWLPEDAGNRYRGERTGNVPYANSALTWLGTSQTPYLSAYQLKTENGSHTPWVDLIHTIDVLNNTPVAQLPVELPKVLDVDNALRFLAVANLTAWLDSYLGRTCKNFYLYEDLCHGRMVILPWDVNNGFGGLTDGLTTTGVARIDPFFREFDSANPRPLLTRIVQRPEWRARYLAHYRTMLPEFSWSTLGARIQQLRAMIRPLVAADTRSIYTLQFFDQNLTTALNVGIVTVPGLQPFFQDRNAFLASHAELRKVAPTLANLTHTPAAPTPQQGVTVNVTVSGAAATAVTLHHRVQGRFVETPMFDDGNHGDGAANDGVYGATIPPQGPLRLVEYYVGANGDLATGGAMAFLPPLAEFTARSYRVRGVPPEGAVQISEFVAKNDNGIRDEAGEREDWIELVNTGTQSVAVGGLYLTDTVAEPAKWRIPDGQTLPPGGTLIVWADENGTQGPLHANFKLSADGEELALYDRDGVTNLDWIEFGAQSADTSTGRLPGFPAVDVTFAIPTPRQVNRAEPGGHLGYNAPDPRTAPLRLWGEGLPAPGQGVDYMVSRAWPNAPGVVLVGGSPTVLPLSGFGPLLVHPGGLLAFAIQTDVTGSATWRLTIPADPGLAGVTFFSQAFVQAGTGGYFSDAIATRIAP
ncbi:MAG: CotH kinase family protein [Planctomycetes bacterium]|nr:CotH kinase family protein [Planctomycetota bacterium]